MELKNQRNHSGVQGPPPFGWVNELARLAGCDRKTVQTAMRRNARGIKAERVRQLYRQKYGNQNV